ncbi:MAG: DUF1499 domain-containing protein [Pseudohongiellaceae bacterium]
MKKRPFTLACLPLLSACAGEPPQNLGPTGDGRLSPCPDSPNCVSSFSGEERHAIEPLQADLAAIRDVIGGLDNADVVSSDGEHYLRAEFTTRIIGFVDDVEFLHDPAQGVTHVRSASRVGYSDLGANRQRIERLRQRLNDD